MKKRSLLVTLIALMPLSVLASGQNPLLTSEKSLPIPFHAAESIQNLLKVAPAPQSRETAKQVNLPKTEQEWKDFVVEFDRNGIEQGRSVAKELNVEYKVTHIAGVEVYQLTPSTIAKENKNNLFLHIHGGAWLFGGGDSLLREAALTAHKLQMSVISINYRKAPAHPAPAALNDIITVWDTLIQQRQADSIMMGGTSAGGNLTAAATLRMQDLNMPTPGALFIGTPSVDLVETLDSRHINDGVDGILGSWNGIPEASVAQYIANLDPKSPYLSPIYGEFSAFPPTILVSGTRDLLLSDTVLLHRAIRDAGSEADLHIYEGHSHGFYIIPGKDRTNFYGEMNRFSDKHLARYSAVAPTEVNATFNLENLLISEGH